MAISCVVELSRKNYCVLWKKNIKKNDDVLKHRVSLMPSPHPVLFLADVGVLLYSKHHVISKENEHGALI